MKVALFPSTVGLDYEFGLKTIFAFSLTQSPKLKVLQEQRNVWRGEERQYFTSNHTDGHAIVSKERQPLGK